MAKALCCLIGALMLVSCATVPGQSTMITDDTALITMMAGGHQSREALYQATLQEAAKVTRGHGFRYFEVLGTEDASQRVLKTIPGNVLSAQNVNNKPLGSTNLSSSFLPGATYTTPDKQVYQVKPGIDITIRMYRDGAIDPMRVGIWNSDTMLAGNTR